LERKGETPAGRVGQVRLLMTQSVKEAHRPPRGKRATAAEINLIQKLQSLQKEL